MRRRQIEAMRAAMLNVWNDKQPVADEPAEDSMTACPKCGKTLKKRGALLHINRCHE